MDLVLVLPLPNPNAEAQVSSWWKVYQKSAYMSTVFGCIQSILSNNVNNIFGLSFIPTQLAVCPKAKTLKT